MAAEHLCQRLRALERYGTQSACTSIGCMHFPRRRAHIYRLRHGRSIRYPRYLARSGSERITDCGSRITLTSCKFWVI